MKWFAILGVSSLLVAGCSTLPPTLSESPPGDPTLRDVRGNATDHQGMRVRWGGVIMSVENEADKTWIQILQKRLNGQGRPRDEQDSEGRFLMWTDGFLDPGIYAEGRRITVFGEVNGQAERTIGRRVLMLPVIKALDHYLWKDYDRTLDYPYPIFNDPYSPYGYDYW